MRSMFLAVGLALWGVAAHAQTQTLVDVATISMSAPGMPRTVTNTVCATDGNDLVCDRGVYITSSSRVGIGTNTPAFALHIVNSVSASGLLMRDDDSAGYISLREGTSTSGTFVPTIQFSPIGVNRFSLIDNFMASADDTGVVPTLQIRTRTSSGNVTRPLLSVQNYMTEVMRLTASGNLGMGTDTPSNTLHIYGPSASGITIGRAGAPGNHGIIDYSSSTLNIGTKTNDGVVFQTNGYSRFGIDRSGFITTRGDVGINIYPTQPSASLHVSGTLLLANGGEACDANRLGAIRYTGGDFSFCRNGSAWETLTGIAGSGQSDRITSGTSSVIVNSATGTVSITTGVSEVASFNSAGLKVRGALDIMIGNAHVFVGAGAGAKAAGLNEITAVGVGAVTSPSGGYIAAVGVNAAGYSAGNTAALGHVAAIYNKGASTVAVGSMAAMYNTAQYLTAVGVGAGQYNQGAGAVAVGPSAGQYNQGVSVTALGFGAALTNLASNVTAVGASAVNGVSNTFSNVTGLGYNAQPTKSNQVMLGDTTIAEVFSYGAGIFNKYVRPGSATTVSLPAASSAGAGAIMYDTTLGGLVYSNGSTWTAIVGGGGASDDRIVSGTSAVVMNSATGIVSISQLGAVASYVHPSVGYVGPGVSTTGAVSTTRVYLAATPNQCATAADIGSMFRSATTGRLQICAERN